MPSQNQEVNTRRVSHQDESRVEKKGRGITANKLSGCHLWAHYQGINHLEGILPTIPRKERRPSPHCSPKKIAHPFPGSNCFQKHLALLWQHSEKKWDYKTFSCAIILRCYLWSFHTRWVSTKCKSNHFLNALEATIHIFNMLNSEWFKIYKAFHRSLCRPASQKIWEVETGGTISFSQVRKLRLREFERLVHTLRWTPAISK